MIYGKPATSLHIFSVQPSGGIYPSYTITGINNGVANEPGRAPREPSARSWGQHGHWGPLTLPRKTPSPLFTNGETEAGAQLAAPLGYSTSRLSVLAGNGDFFVRTGQCIGQ